LDSVFEENERENTTVWRSLRQFAKQLVLAVLPDSERLRSLAYRPKFESWCRAQAGNYPVFREREELYEYLNRVVLGNQPVTYLEFGVFEGASIKRFAELNSSPESCFVGFDTFTGLPEDWVEVSRTVKSGTFSTGGATPFVQDRRIYFVKGLFQDTLAPFLEHYDGPSQWVIHNDSDLYSATLFVLTCAHEYIKKGTIIIFDEFCSPMHEFRALDDYCAAYRRTIEVLAITESFGKIAVRFN
jgi:hypothetical protein